MIKVTREFATAEEAVAWLTGGSSPATPAVPQGTPAIPAYAQPAAPAAPTPLPPAPPVAAAPAPLPPAAPAHVPAPATAPATSAPLPAPAAANHGITQAQVAAAAQAYSKAYKPAATKAVFAHFGITKISDAKPEIYPQLLQSLTVQQ